MQLRRFSRCVGGSIQRQVRVERKGRKENQDSFAAFALANRVSLCQPGAVMQIRERTVGDVTIVDVAGKVTLGEGGDTMLKDKLRSLVHQGRRKLLLNLADVSYLDSAGLGAIVQSYTTVTNQGGSLKLLNLTKRIKDLLAITKLITVFDTYDNEGEAVNSFSS